MKYLIFFSLFFVSFYSFNQTLQPFVEEVSDNYPRFNDLVFDTEGNMYAGCNYAGNDRIAIIKYDAEGSFIDSVFIGVDYDEIGVVLMEMENDTLYVFSKLTLENGDKRILISSMSNDLDFYWQREFSIGNYYAVFRFRKFEFKNYKYLHLSSTPSYFIRLDNNYNLDSVFVISEFLKNSEPIFYTDSGFVYPTNYGSKVMWHFNEDLEVTWSDTVPDNVFNFVYAGIHRLPNGNYLMGDVLNSPNKISFVTDTFTFMHRYEQFGDDDDRFSVTRTFAPNYDTSVVYASGYADINPHYWVSMGNNKPNAIWVAKFDQDTLLWHNYYEDSYYYVTTNMRVGPDDAVYVSATKYDAINQPDSRSTVIFRVEPDGTLPVGLANSPERTSVSVYPNPGQDQIHIETGNSYGVFSMYNLNGQIVLSQELKGKEVLGTEDLTQGIYFYRFVNSQGEVASGKWVKE
jgi:hypothetical protein